MCRLKLSLWVNKVSQHHTLLPQTLFALCITRCFALIWFFVSFPLALILVSSLVLFFLSWYLYYFPSNSSISQFFSSPWTIGSWMTCTTKSGQTMLGPTTTSYGTCWPKMGCLLSKPTRRSVTPGLKITRLVDQQVAEDEAAAAAQAQQQQQDPPVQPQVSNPSSTLWVQGPIRMVLINKRLTNVSLYKLHK